MLFSSIPFLFYFLPIVLVLYSISSNITYKNTILLISSLIFYAWGEPKYVFLLIGSVCVNYVIGRYIWNRRPVMVLGVLFNVLLLVFFKYTAQFFPGFLSITLPLGISFYTFQSLSYLLDVYWGNVTYQKSIVSFGCFVTLFPQLIAGPIVRYHDVDAELQQRQSDLYSGIPLFILGLSEKVLLANNCGLIWEAIQDKLSFPGSSISVGAFWLSIIAYAFQIYFDFAGYSNMAIGLGRIFGFHFSRNFHKPYISRSITEFWTRWHISLSSWFKEYVYIPLGGNRNGLMKQLRNILIVWMLTGIWHGASYNFLLWGLYFGLLLVLEKLGWKQILAKMPKILQHLYTCIAILLGWVLFAFDSPSTLFAFYGGMFGMREVSQPLVDSTFWYLLENNWVLLLSCALLSSNALESLVSWLDAWSEKYSTQVSMQIWKSVKVVTQAALLLLCFLLSIAYIVDGSYNPFLYFRF